MRILVILLTAVILLTQGACYAQDVTIPGEKLAFNVFKDCCADDKNVMLSPYSLYAALSMTARGARGDTLDQILKALDTDDAAFIKANGASVANAAFIAPNAEIKSDYLVSLSDFDARIFTLKEGDMDDINNWARDATNGLIDPFITTPLDQSTTLAVMNAISLDARWESPFNAKDTRESVFHTLNGDVQTPFMNQTLYMDYGDKGDMSLGVLPYKDSSLKAYFILPQSLDMSDAIEKLAKEGYSLFDGLEERRVCISLPKLDATSDLKLSKSLINNGVVDAFSFNADLSGINGKYDLMVDEIFQKSALKIDEDGTRAASAGYVSIIPKGMIVEERVSFCLDRLFIMLIKDELSGQTLFCARVVNPCE